MKHGGNAYGGHLEFGHPTDWVEVRSSQAVGAIATSPVEGSEQRIGANVGGEFSSELGCAPPAFDQHTAASVNAVSQGEPRMNLKLWNRLRGC